MRQSVEKLNRRAWSCCLVIAASGLISCDPQREADRAAWTAIAESTAPTEARGAKPGESPVLFRLWWTQEEVYTSRVARDVFTGPQKTGISDRIRGLTCRGESEREFQGRQSDDTACEAVFLNEPAASYIFDHRLWDRCQLIRLRGQIHLPQEAGHIAREIKTEWRNIKPEQAPQYITALDTEDPHHPQLKGLVAFHLMSHESPTWIWATWLHRDLSWMMPLEIGFHDSFGANPDKSVSEDLLQLLKTNHTEVLQNYRLIGTQRAFSTPASLGNPMIEGRSVQALKNSSCMGCHAYAAIDGRGGWNVPHGPNAGGPPRGVDPIDFDFSIVLRAACVAKCPGPCNELEEITSKPLLRPAEPGKR